MGRPSFNTDSFATIVIAALLYYLSYLSTYQLSSLFEFSHATSWVYLPSGVRLLLVLVLMESGAWAIMLGTLGIDYGFHLSTNHWYNGVTAAIAGGSTYLSLRLAQRWCRLQPDLSDMNPGQLMGVCMIFSVVSPLAHQIWYTIDGDTSQFWSSLSVMALGDWGGSVIVLGTLYWVFRLWRWLQAP